MRRKAEIDALRERIQAVLTRRDLSLDARRVLRHMEEVLTWARGWRSEIIDKLLSGEIPREEKTNDAGTNHTRAEPLPHGARA